MRRAGVNPPTRPSFILMMRQAPSAMAACACSSVWMHSSRQIGVMSWRCNPMAPDIVPAEGLLDHHQIVGFEFAKSGGIFQSISRIRIHHQANLGKAPPQARDRLHIVAGLDLDLDALIAGSQFSFHDALELLVAFLNADGDATGNLLQRAAEKLP